MTRREHHFAGFTLVEMLATTLLVAVLMAAVLLMLSGMSADRRRLHSHEQSISASESRGLVELLRCDLANASAMTQSEQGRTLVLLGHAGLNARTLAPTGRLARVIYRVVNDKAGPRLVRQQVYLDDPVNRQPWEELAACGVTRLTILPTSDDGQVVHDEQEALSNQAPAQSLETRRVPTRLRLRIEFVGRGAIDEEVWTR